MKSDSIFSLFSELVLRQKKSLIHPDTVILCVVDPKPNIGSGGATLNAIFSITEHISAIKGHTVSIIQSFSPCSIWKCV